MTAASTDPGPAPPGAADPQPAEHWPVTDSSQGAPGDAEATAFDQTFAHSMIMSGAVALAVSIAGMVMVARRRRLW